MTSITHLKGSLTERNDEAQVKLVENEAALAAAKARFWRSLASIASVGMLAAWLAVAALLIVLVALGLSTVVSWF